MNSISPALSIQPIGVIADRGQEFYARHVNPEWAKLVNLFQMNLHYTHCRGAELETVEGRTILDFLSGYCVHNTGHNHPYIVQQVVEELQSDGPGMLQSNIVESAGKLAEALCRRAGGKVSKVFFCSSGSEGIEAVIKFSRAFTGRTDIVYAKGAFYGLTCGALSQIDYFVESISNVMSMMHSSGSFWSDAIKLGRRAVSA